MTAAITTVNVKILLAKGSLQKDKFYSSDLKKDRQLNLNPLISCTTSK
jgi:hypothetical protein